VHVRSVTLVLHYVLIKIHIYKVFPSICLVYHNTIICIFISCNSYFMFSKCSAQISYFPRCFTSFLFCSIILNFFLAVFIFGVAVRNSVNIKMFFILLYLASVDRWVCPIEGRNTWQCFADFSRNIVLYWHTRLEYWPVL
jgi:hypothetical protein